VLISALRPFDQSLIDFALTHGCFSLGMFIAMFMVRSIAQHFLPRGELIIHICDAL